MINSPTALNKRGTKVYLDNCKFDSQKEARFYANFVKKCGYDYDVHPRFDLFKVQKLDHMTVGQIVYTPDFVIYDKDGQMLHVYDVKNSFGEYGIDAAAALRFKIFAHRYKIPVEAVVMRTNDFKVIAQGCTKRRPPDRPLVRNDFGYSWIRATNYEEAYQ